MTERDEARRTASLIAPQRMSLDDGTDLPRLHCCGSLRRADRGEAKARSNDHRLRVLAAPDETALHGIDDAP
jgi:hypothetical protein